MKHSRHAFKKFFELIIEPNLEQRLADTVQGSESAIRQCEFAKELVNKVVPLTCMIGSSSRTVLLRAKASSRNLPALCIDLV